MSEEEVHSVVKYIIENNEPITFEGADEITSDKAAAEAVSDGEADDSLYEEAKRIALDSGKVSASLLQRRLRVGYARGARLVDMLEDKGVVGRAEGNKPREVISADDDHGAFSAPPTGSLPGAPQGSVMDDSDSFNNYEDSELEEKDDDFSSPKPEQW